MAPRTRTKSTKVGRLQRQPTQFGELETTPTSRDHQAAGNRPLTADDQSFVPDGRENRQRLQSDMFDDDLEDVDLIKLDDEMTSQPIQPRSFAWSEAGSLTRRSSPARSGDTPRDIWQFDDGDSLAPFSSPKPDTNMLPDTVPLPYEDHFEEKQRLQTERRIDFSETASTARRSSPFGLGDALKEIWDFHKSPSTGAFSTANANHGNLPDTLPIRSTHSPPHLPLEELYDATPQSTKLRKIADDNENSRDVAPMSSRSHFWQPSLNNKSRKEKAMGKKNQSDEAPDAIPYEPPSNLEPQQKSPLLLLPGNVVGPSKSQRTEPRSNKANRCEAESTDELQHQQPPSGSPVVQPPSVDNRKGKKRKQRAKAPIQFDEATKEIKKPPQAKKKQKPAPTRLPIVRALQESAKSSSSPVVVPRKRPAGKSTQPKKKGKNSAPKPPQKTPTTALTQKNMDIEQCLAPSKLPSKRELEASQENKLTPCSGKDVGKENGTEGHAQPVVIPSDSLDGLSNDDSPFSPPDTSRPSWLERAQGKRQIQHPGFDKTNSQEKIKRVKPEAPPSIGDTADKKAVPASAMAQNISKAQNPESTNDVTDQGSIKGTRTGLAKRDPNILTTRSNGPPNRGDSAKNSTTGRQGLGRFGDTANVQQLTGRRLSRQFSVSEKGSPVPVKHAARIDIPSAEDGGPWSIETDLPHNRQHQKFPVTDADIAFVSESSILPGIDFGKKRISDGDTQVSQRPTMKGYVPSSSWLQTTDQQSDLAPAHRQRHSVNDELRAQILASFEQNRGDIGDQNMQEQGIEREDKLHVNKPWTVQGNDISKQLHQVIDQLTAHLASKEATVYKVADVYRQSGIECVGRLQRRCLKEGKAFADMFNKDGVQFGKVLQNARETIETNSRGRERSVMELEESLAQRRIMYERASTSLRALHGQLLGEQGAQMGNRSES